MKILSKIWISSKSLGFSGKSEIIRAGIRNLLSDERMKEDLDGEINSLLLAVH